MSDERTSADVSLETLRLLWRAELDQAASGGGPGRPRMLSVDGVVESAVALADTSGLEALTMRSLASDLGVRAMTLYNYVPSRSDLIDLMLDAVYAAMPRQHLAGGTWQQCVREVADANRLMLIGHPWAAVVSTARPPLGPGQMAKYEHELQAFSGSGLTDLQADDSLICILSFVQANVRDHSTSARAREQDGRNDAEWWTAVQPLLGRFLDPATYPRAARIGAAAGTARGSAYDPDHAYRFGLDRLIEGIARLSQTVT